MPRLNTHQTRHLHLVDLLRQPAPQNPAGNVRCHLDDAFDYLSGGEEPRGEELMRMLRATTQRPVYDRDGFYGD